MITHTDESTSNELRATLESTEPDCLRTKTTSMAVLAKSEGSYHYTPEGRKLADFTSGVLVANIGHNPKRWWKRVLELMGLDNLDADGDFLPAVTLTSYNAVTEVEMEANRCLLENLQAQPGGSRMEQILWAASGSEAIQKGLWACLARREGEDIILATRGGFHGKKGLAGAVTGSEDDPERDPRVRFISFPKEECASIEKRRETIDLTPYREELEALKAEYGNRLCCLITEPYLGGGGSYHPHKEYMQMLESFCRENDVIFILDEIQANFGRTGSMYAFSEYGIEPDLVALGKGMGNGVPVDAIAGRSDLFGVMGFGAGSDTWSAHPLGCASVIATLEEFEKDDIMGQAAGLSEIIEEALVRLTELPAVTAVRGEGTVWGIEFAPLGELSADEVAHEVVLRAYLGSEEGKAIHLLGPLAGKVIRIAPPLNMNHDEAREYFDVLHGMIAGM